MFEWKEINLTWLRVTRAQVRRTVGVVAAVIGPLGALVDVVALDFVADRRGAEAVVADARRGARVAVDARRVGAADFVLALVDQIDVRIIFLRVNFVM